MGRHLVEKGLGHLAAAYISDTDKEDFHRTSPGGVILNIDTRIISLSNGTADSEGEKRGSSLPMPGTAGLH
jgi:hypothetical protein